MPLILVVDDHPETCALIARLLRSQGYTVTSATDGAAALTAAATQSPDLVIADILLPDVNGLLVIATLRQRDPDLPIIAMSAVHEVLEHPEFVPAGLDPDAITFLAKPFALAALTDLVQQQVRQPLLV